MSNPENHLTTPNEAATAYTGTYFKRSKLPKSPFQAKEVSFLNTQFNGLFGFAQKDPGRLGPRRGPETMWSRKH